MPLPKNYQTLFQKFNNKIFIETGTCNGASLKQIVELNKYTQIHTVEYLQKSEYHDLDKVRQEFSIYPHVNIVKDHSVNFLKNLLPTINESCTFWLDAHYPGTADKKEYHNNGLPLKDEIQVIKNHWINTHTILVDDVRDFARFYETNTQEIEKMLLDINPNYHLKYFDCRFPKDVLVASIIPFDDIKNQEIDCDILSFPRSGNHLLRFIIEYLSGRPTLGNKTTNINNQIITNPEDTPIHTKKFKNPTLLNHVNGEPIAQKYNKPEEFMCGNKLILILRNPIEAILSHKKPIDHTHLNWYFTLVNYFHESQKPKLLIKYQELINDPKKIALEIYTFLELQNDTFLKQFIQNSDQIIQDSKNCDTELTAYQNKSGNNPTYYLKQQSPEQIQEYVKLINMYPQHLLKYIITK